MAGCWLGGLAVEFRGSAFLECWRLDDGRRGYWLGGFVVSLGVLLFSYVGVLDHERRAVGCWLGILAVGLGVLRFWYVGVRDDGRWTAGCLLGILAVGLVGLPFWNAGVGTTDGGVLAWGLCC